MPTPRLATMVAMLVIACAGSLPSHASEAVQDVVSQIRLESYAHILDRELPTHEAHNRGSVFGANCADARAAIINRFESYGLEVELEPFSWRGGTAYNIVATQIGTTYPEAQYILGAHHDSVNNAGADDNASGVAALLEIARVMSAYETDCTIKYIAFDVEEVGLTGSNDYVDNHAGEDIRAMFSLDMISWDDGSYTLDIRAPSLAEELVDNLIAAIEAYGGALNYEVIWGPAASDNQPFATAGYQAALLIEHDYLSNACWHQPCDTMDNLGYISLDYATDIVRSVAGWLAGQAGARPPADCDGDGTPDADEIAADASLDCNTNGILDACEYLGTQDLDGSGVPDVCEILSGACSDCNGDWVPDELQPAFYEDCNGNGIPDLCDIAALTVQDVNLNYVIDDCERYRTLYVNDNAPNDPGPGDPEVSDPAEDGSLFHPFDSIDEALADAVHGDEIVVMAGVYTGAQNRDLSMRMKRITLRSMSGPADTIIDMQGEGRGMLFIGGPNSEGAVAGLTFINGYAEGGGAMRFENGAAPFVANCIFMDNVEEAEGGGAVYGTGGDPEFVNCLFVGNASYKPITMAKGIGGAAFLTNGWAWFNHCTFYGNYAEIAGGAVATKSASGVLTNSIAWGNESPSGAQLAVRYSGQMYVAHCDVAGGEAGVFRGTATDLAWAEGNIESPPLFLDPNASDFQLQLPSPCVDAGGSVYVMRDLADLDLDGDRTELTPYDLEYDGRYYDEPQIEDTGCGVGAIADIGAYELGGTGPQPCLGDLNGDNRVDLADLQLVLAGYGQPDGLDLDCDGDCDLHDLGAVLRVYGLECSQ